MSPWLGVSSLGPALPAHCEPQSELLHRLSSTFHTCMPTPLALLSTVLGCLSFTSWLFAQLPQVYKNYQVQSTAGLSIFFLLEWLAGDTTNLAGAIMTNQAAWQVLIATYYTSIDCVLVWQHIYYTHYLPWRQERDMTRSWLLYHEDDDSEEEENIPGYEQDTSEEASKRFLRADYQNSHARNIEVSPGSSEAPSLSTTPREKGISITHSGRTIHPRSSSPMASPRTMLLISMVLMALSRASPLPSANAPLVANSAATSDSDAILRGKIVSWTSTVMYLLSRMPQIYKNARRRSTSGLSIALFAAAFAGNLFYSTSLLTNPLAWDSFEPHGHNGWAGPQGSDQHEWVMRAMPFFLGAAGVLLMDLTIGLQFLAYGDGEDRLGKIVRVMDSSGHSRWRRISGWMRGWVPSPRVTPDPSVEGASTAGETEYDEDLNDERPLLQREESYGPGRRAYDTI